MQGQMGSTRKIALQGGEVSAKREWVVIVKLLRVASKGKTIYTAEL